MYRVKFIYRLWVDVSRFFNGKEISTYNPETEEFFYNDKENLVIIDDVHPDENTRIIEVEEHILSMGFDSRLYEVLNYTLYEIDDEELSIFHERDEFVSNLINEFCGIFKKYGLDCYWGDSYLICDYNRSR